MSGDGKIFDAVAQKSLLSAMDKFIAKAAPCRLCMLPMYSILHNNL